MNCVRLELEDNFLDVASTGYIDWHTLLKKLNKILEFAASIALPASTALL